MKNEYVLDFTGLTIDGAEKEITRYIRAISSPSSKKSTSRNSILAVLKRLRNLYQKLLSDLEDKIHKLETVTDDNVDTVLPDTYDNDYNLSELLRKQISHTLQLSIDTRYTTAIEEKKQVRKSDIVFITFYQSCSDIYTDMYDTLKNLDRDCVFLATKDQKKVQHDMLNSKHREMILSRCMQYFYVERAEQYYLSSMFSQISSEKQNQNSENMCTRAFRTMLASYLFEWRKTHGYTKQELAQSSGIERTTISNLETMRQSASIDKIIQLLQTTGAGLVIVPLNKTLEE